MPSTNSDSARTKPEPLAHSASMEHASARATLSVKGMTCAACVTFVQSTLANLPGVRTAAVNLAMESAAVEYDPLTISPQKLVEAINDTGYQAALPEPGQGAAAQQ